MNPRRITIISLLLTALFNPSGPAYAVSEDEKSFLAMYFKEEELVVISATRSLKSITRVSKNVEVVTAEDIELMNAHTVAEALYNVIGIELINYKGPGSGGFPAIHGSDIGRVAVFMDGVPLLNANNTIPLAILPVQMIRKIEIIKGPASSIWGSSFGGVINIITKSVETGEGTAGTVYASGGERNTSDVRLEVSGRKDRVGIYLYGGMMNSDGPMRGNEFWHNNLFARINIDADQKSKIDLSFYYHKDDSVNIDFRSAGRDAYNAFTHETVYGKAAIHTAPVMDIDLDISAWMIKQNGEFYENAVSTDTRLGGISTIFDRYGLSGSLIWKAGDHTLVAGADLLNSRLTQDSISGDLHKLRKHALFINDSIVVNKLTVTPGLRYDYASLGGDIVSPSLGVTYLAAKDILFRAAVSRGFHDPAITKFIDAPGVGYIANQGLKPEKIWSYQAGAEVNLFDILRAKLSFFCHEIDDLIFNKFLGQRRSTAVNGGSARTAGGEFEVATKKYNGIALKGGFHYERTRLDGFSDPAFFDVSKVYGINAALSYSEDKGLSAMLRGHYLWWNRPSFWQGKYNGVVVDFNIIKCVLKNKDHSADVFFTAHNIFNGPSYNEIANRNPNRWIEAGARYKF